MLYWDWLEAAAFVFGPKQHWATSSRERDVAFTPQQVAEILMNSQSDPKSNVDIDNIRIGLWITRRKRSRFWSEVSVDVNRDMCRHLQIKIFEI